MLMKEGWEKGRKKMCAKNVHWKETEPLAVSYKVPVGCKPTERASEEIPDKRILQEEKEEWSLLELSF